MTDPDQRVIMTESEGMDDDQLFNTGNIFSNRELVTVGHVPSEDRIVGREREMRQVGQAIAPGTEGGPPKNLIIYGKTGTGKSLVVRHVVRRAEGRARDQNVNLVSCYVDSSNEDTETRVAREMAFSVRDKLNPALNIPSSGIGSAEYYRYLWELLEDQDVLLVILDEIDKLRDDDVLMQLSRAKESGKTTCHVGVISISNKIEYRKRLNKRIDSSLQDREHVFDPYNASQLEAILENRRDAFRRGVLSEGVIGLTAALSAQEHGDARKAIDILHESGELATGEGATQVTEGHVRDAKEQAEINRFKELVRGSPSHVQYVLRALAALTLNAEEGESENFRTKEIYALYEEMVQYDDGDPLKVDSVYRLLDEQSFLGITETEHTGGGREKGSYLKHTLLTDPEIVLNGIRDANEAEPFHE